MSSSKNNILSFAGDVTLNDVTIITSKGLAITITPQVDGLEMYEDIFSPFVSGKLYVRDSQSLGTLFPLVGEEILRLNMYTPEMPAEYAINGEYYIYKLDDRMITKEREEVFVLHFISKEAIVDLNRKISKVYHGNIADIVTSIITGTDGLESQKKANVEGTANATKFISNFWSPVRSINFLTEAAQSKENQSPTFLFFENRNGLNFSSLDSMYKADVYQQFFYDNSGMVPNSGGGTSRDILRDFKRITTFDIQDSFDYISRISSGMYGSQLTHYDLVTKKYTRVGYTPRPDANNHLNEHPLWTENLIARNSSLMIQEFKHYNNYDGFKDLSNANNISNRLSALAQLDAFKIKITVTGRTDYAAGMVVDLTVPKRTQINKDQTPDQFLDKVLSGKYLVTALCHLITKDGHECIMELSKETLMVDLNNE
jgi:hypothetical protein